MGFFLVNPDTGTVIDQFPHLYPTAIAIGYDMAGLTGARHASTACAVIGVLALYFLGARLIGKPAGAAAAGLLAIHLVQVWHARIPNSEVLAQGLLLTGLLALARAHQDDDVFFAPVAGVALGLLPFARFDGVLAIALAGAGLELPGSSAGVFAGISGPARRRQPWRSLRSTCSPGCAVCRESADLGDGQRLPQRSRCGRARRCAWPVVVAAPGTASPPLRRWAAPCPHRRRGAGGLRLVPAEPEGKLALHDAESLACSAGTSIPPPSRRRWQGCHRRAAGLLARSRLFSGRVRHRHFRLLSNPHRARALLGDAPLSPIILPAVLWASRRRCCCRWPARRGDPGARGARAGRYGLRLAVLAMVAWGFWSATDRIRPHVEYAGVIARLEAIGRAIHGAGSRGCRITQRIGRACPRAAAGLRLRPARAGLNSPKPDKAVFEVFLGWARQHFARSISSAAAAPICCRGRSPWNQSQASDFRSPSTSRCATPYPTGVRYKEFDFGIYKFVPPPPGAA